MRYLYTIAGVMLMILGLAGMTFVKFDKTSSKGLARINERVITVEEFQKAYAEKSATSPAPLDKKRFLEEMITRELLIQESKRRGLDLREPFRRSIQNYYEQTLLKNLAQARMAEIQTGVDEKEIASYHENMGKVFELRVIPFMTEDEAIQAIKHFPLDKAEKKVLRFDDAPIEIIDAMETLRPGGVYQKPVKFNKVFLAVRLEGVRKEPILSLATVHDEIRRTLEDKKKREEMDKWLDVLRKKASIELNEELLKEGK